MWRGGFAVRSYRLGLSGDGPLGRFAVHANCGGSGERDNVDLPTHASSSGSSGNCALEIRARHC